MQLTTAGVNGSWENKEVSEPRQKDIERLLYRGGKEGRIACAETMWLQRVEEAPACINKMWLVASKYRAVQGDGRTCPRDGDQGQLSLCGTGK